MGSPLNIHGLIKSAKEKSFINIKVLNKEKQEIQEKIKELYNSLQKINKKFLVHEKFLYGYDGYFDEPVTEKMLKKEIKLLMKYIEDNNVSQ